MTTRRIRPDRFTTFYFSGLPEAEFAYYAGAFQEAARALVRSLRRKRGFRDVEALPVLFLYRHAIELYMKAIIIQGEGIWLSDSSERESLFKGLRVHRLGPLLTRIQAVLKSYDMKWWWPNDSIQTFADVRRFVSFLDQRDPVGAAFRYPVDAKGARSIPADFAFGFFALVSVLDAFALALDCFENLRNRGMSPWPAAQLCAAPDLEPRVAESRVRYPSACGSKPVSLNPLGPATMCLQMTAHPNVEGRVSARRLSSASGLAIQKHRGDLWFAEQPACSCSLLTDNADFSDETWDLRPEVHEPLAEALELLGREAGGFTFQAVWAGDRIESDSQVSLPAFLAVVRTNRVLNAHRYQVGRAQLALAPDAARLVATFQASGTFCYSAA